MIRLHSTHPIHSQWKSKKNAGNIRAAYVYKLEIRDTASSIPCSIS